MFVKALEAAEKIKNKNKIFLKYLKTKPWHKNSYICPDTSHQCCESGWFYSDSATTF